MFVPVLKAALSKIDMTLAYSAGPFSALKAMFGRAIVGGILGLSVAESQKKSLVGLPIWVAL